MWNVGENQEFGFDFQTPGSFLSDDRLAIPLVKNEDVAVFGLHILCKLRIYHQVGRADKESVFLLIRS